MDQRVFYGLLERVGGKGRYQTILLVIWSVLMSFMGSTQFFLPFVFYQSDYQCPQGYNNCKHYVCSLPSSDRAQFIHDEAYTLPTKFGDFRCDNNVQLDWLQTLIYCGGVIGVFIGALINELITKRKLLIITVIGNIISIGLTIFNISLPVSSIGLCINFGCCAIQLEIIQCFIVETVSEEIRGQHIAITFVFYSLGVTLNGLFFYLLQNFIIYFIILLPILFVILLFLLYYIEETPFDLIITSTPQESLRALMHIASANDRDQQHRLSFQEIYNIQTEYQDNEEKKEHDNISILDLFRFQSLRTLTIVSLILHYVIPFQFAVPEVAIRNYSLDIYTNGIVIGFAELIGSIFCYFIIDDFQRKKVIYITQAICIVSSASVFFFFSCVDKKCSISTEIIQTIGLTIFRFAATIAYNIFYMMQYQAFPNQIRGLALQVVCIPSYFAAVNIPQIITYCQNSGISIVFTFIICSVITVAMMTCLPQTFGIPPPEIIEELKYQHHDIADPNAQEKIKQT